MRKVLLTWDIKMEVAIRVEDAPKPRPVASYQLSLRSTEHWSGFSGPRRAAGHDSAVKQTARSPLRLYVIRT